MSIRHSYPSRTERPDKLRKLALTQDHIARIHRVVEDSGIPPGLQPQTDADYDGWVEQMLRSHPAPHKPTFLFAYGSLIWKPEIDHVGEQIGDGGVWHSYIFFCVT